MANQLKMAIVRAILHLYSLHWSQRRIAAELEIDRRTIQRHLSRHLRRSNAAIPPTGSEGPNAATFSAPPALAVAASGDLASADSAAGSNATILPAGSEQAIGQLNAAISPAGSPATSRCQEATSAGRRSQCVPYRELILAMLGRGLSAQRIWQDLATEHQFRASTRRGQRVLQCLPAAGDPLLQFQRSLEAPFQVVDTAMGCAELGQRDRAPKAEEQCNGGRN